MCLFNNWQGLGTGNSSANNNFIDWGCTGACTSHGHISAVKPHGARGFMSPNCTTISWKSRNEPFKIIKERRELSFLFIFLFLFPSLHWPCSQHPALGSRHRDAQSIPKFQLLHKPIVHLPLPFQTPSAQGHKCSVWMPDRHMETIPA